MKNFKRLLAIMLVFALLFSGINISILETSSPKDVYAAGGTEGGSSSSGGGGVGSAVGGALVPRGTGWRLYLTLNGIIDTSSGTTISNYYSYLSSSRSNFGSIYLSDSADGQATPSYIKELGTNNSASAQYRDNTCITNRLSGIFPSMASYDSQFKVTWGTYGNEVNIYGDKTIYFSSDVTKQGGPLDTYLSDHFEEAINYYCSAIGLSYYDFTNFLKSNNLDLSNIYFVLEPVIYSGINGNFTYEYAHSLNDLCDQADTTRSTLSGAIKQFNISDYIEAWKNPWWMSCNVDSAPINIRYLAYMRTVIFDYYGQAGTSLANKHFYSSDALENSGFGLYGISKAGYAGSYPSKISPSYTIKYNGGTTDTGKGFTVTNSTNIISYSNYGTINHSAEGMKVSSTSASKLVLDSYGKSILSTFNTNNAGSYKNALSQVSGFPTSKFTGDETDGYVLTDNSVQITTGRFRVNFADNATGASTDLASVVNSVAGSVTSSKYSLVPVARKVNTGNMNIGSTYTLGIKDGSSSKSIGDMSFGLIDSLVKATNHFSGADLSVNQVNESKGYGVPRGIAGKIPNIIYNFSLNTLLHSSTLDSISPGGFKASAKSTSDVQITFVAENKKVTSYIKYATYDRNTGKVTYNTSKNSSKTYSVTNPESFTVDLSNGNAFAVAVPANKVNATGDGSDVFGKLGKIYSINDYYNAVKKVVSTYTSIGRIGSGNSKIGIGTAGVDSNACGYVIYILDFKGDVNKASTLTLKDYELNYVFPSMITNKANIERPIYVGTNMNITGNSTYKGNIIDINKTIGSNKLLLQNDGYTGGVFDTEYKGRTGAYFYYDGATSDGSRLASKVKLSLATNLRRKDFGDNVVLSGLSYNPSSMDTYFNTVLGISTAIVPVASSSGVSSDRNSNAVIGSYKQDTFSWNINYMSGFKNYNINYNITENAHKYKTLALGTALNTVGKVDLSLTDGYKVAVVKSSDKDLSFYPEVIMKGYKALGETLNSNNVISGNKYFVIGEQKRALKPSSMYTIKLNKIAGSSSLKGETLSSSVGVGSNASNVSDGKPVVYAGGDMSLNTSAHYKLNMYGYALDMFKTSDYGTSGVSANSYMKNANPYDTWGNTSVGYNPKNEFTSWVNDTVSSLRADFTLKVNGSGVNKTYNNFNSAISKANVNAVAEDGAFTIKVQFGEIVQDQYYTMLINQIASDYDCTTDEAKELFKNSGIYKSIADAVEDSKDAFNKSQKVADINSTEHWYDEMVQTFVIRRYTYSHNIDGMTVNDKLDYGSAPTGSASSGTQQDYKKADAKWYLTIYFNKVPSGLTGGVLYNPSSYSGLTSAYNSGTVLVKEEYINNADFVVPSASTSEMIN